MFVEVQAGEGELLLDCLSRLDGCGVIYVHMSCMEAGE